VSFERKEASASTITIGIQAVYSPIELPWLGGDVPIFPVPLLLSHPAYCRLSARALAYEVVSRVRFVRLFPPLLKAAVSLLLCCSVSCTTPPPTVAIIPRTTGMALWEPEHAGAQIAADRYGLKVYWNAPTREDDVQGQIALVERTIERHYAGLILSPDQNLALMTVVRRALSRDIPIVILGSALPLEPGGNLSYVLNDEDETGRMAAARMDAILSGTGTIAVVGINPAVAGIPERVRSFESSLASSYPGLHVIEKRAGSFNVPYEQQITEEVLNSHPDLSAIFAVSSDATRGAYSALVELHKTGAVKLIGCDQDLLLPLVTGELDSVLAENTFEMGRQALEFLAEERKGQPIPAITRFKPVLVTKSNINSPEIRKILGLMG
jgi:ribose transport system substrate-binding protein